MLKVKGTCGVFILSLKKLLSQSWSRGDDSNFTWRSINSTVKLIKAIFLKKGCGLT